MRILSGSARGRPLKGPKGPGIRPTADRVRETLFNVLGQYLEGGEVLDLFAGTGALALEALSRGAARAVLVDSGREALGLIRENAAALGFAERCEVLPSDALRALEHLGREGRRFALVFADPPYAQKVIADLLQGMVPDRGVGDGWHGGPRARQARAGAGARGRAGPDRPARVWRDPGHALPSA